MSEIAQLFSTDPLKLTREDFTKVVAEMRKARANFNQGNLKAGSMKPPTEKQKATATKLASIGDLKLDL